MQTFRHQISNPLSALPCEWFPDAEGTVFFDIETTGLSWRNSHLYLLGAVFFDGCQWILQQWFCQRPSEEKTVLEEFQKLLIHRSLLVHFNGKGFDIPYLMHKYTFYQMESPLGTLSQLDLYEKLLPFKKLLGLSHMRQKDLEVFIGLCRLDPFTGGELISCYQNYLKNAEDKLLDTLLLHNREDMEGMLALLPLLAIPSLLDGTLSFQIHGKAGKDFAGIQLTLPLSLPICLDRSVQGIHFTWEGCHVVLDIPFFSGTLKFFYENYKDYYYLPLEDEAIHKSVGVYVDREHRRPAKAADCYRRVTGTFLPQFSSLFTPAFREEYRSPLLYFQPSETFFQQEDCLISYTRHLMKQLKKA